MHAKSHYWSEKNLLKTQTTSEDEHFLTWIIGKCSSESLNENCKNFASGVFVRTAPVNNAAPSKQASSGVVKVKRFRGCSRSFADVETILHMVMLSIRPIVLISFF